MYWKRRLREISFFFRLPRFLERRFKLRALRLLWRFPFLTSRSQARKTTLCAPAPHRESSRIYSMSYLTYIVPYNYLLSVVEKQNQRPSCNSWIRKTTLLYIGDPLIQKNCEIVKEFPEMSEDEGCLIRTERKWKHRGRE